VSVEYEVKLSSVWCLSVRVYGVPTEKSYLVGLFSKRKITPAERHHTTSKMANFAAERAPPPRLLLAISQPKIKLQNRRSNPTGRQDSTHIAVARRRLSPPFASAQASLLLASVFFYRTIIITEVDDDGMITLLCNHPYSGRRCRGSGRGIGGVGRHFDREEWPQFDRHS
jgi:hypothetical protein